MISIGAGRRPSQWRQLFPIAIGLIDQLRELTGGYDFVWSFGGGTAMMIQIGHRESHDVDIFLDDAQLLGFLDPSKSGLIVPTIWQTMAATVRDFRSSPLETWEKSISYWPVH